MTTISVAEIDGCPSGLEPPSSASSPDPSPFVKYQDDGAAQLELAVFGAKCAGCISKIEGGLNAIQGVKSSRLNLTTGKLVVTWQGGAISPKRITDTIASLGYRSKAFDPEAQSADKDEEGRFLLRCMAVAGFATANIMLLSIAVWAGHEGEMGPATRSMMHWVSAIIALPAAAFAGRPFFRSAYSALKVGRANMDVPISLAVILALSLSVYEALNHGRDAYFDAAVMLLFFLLIGRWLDHRLRARAHAAAQSLLNLQSTTANRLNDDGVVESVSARAISPGERIILWPGDRAPVNATIDAGASSVDISLVTGESEPVRLSGGDKIFAGVLNLSDKLTATATATVNDSLVAELARLIEAGEQGRSKYTRLADRAAALYVPLVHSLALATLLGWLFIGDANLRVAVMNAVAVLIITCPCALGLAAPAVQIVATGKLFKAGVLVKSGDALERLAEVDEFVFDKTGTLTHGRLTLSNARKITPETLRYAAMLARTSRHPLARAVVDAVGPGGAAATSLEFAGLGIEGEINGLRARFGRADWVGAEATIDDGVSDAWFRLGDDAPVRFTFEDRIRDDAAETIATLKAHGVGAAMLSGDREGPARRVAKLAGLGNWRAEMSPAEKIRELDKKAADGARVAMVGDGLNDAPALAAAHASLSPGSAADASQAAADFVYQGDGLGAVSIIYDVAKQSRRRVIQNFGFAALYNMCAIPLAVFGFVTPLIAALAMSGSSIIVTLNALRMQIGETQS
ncbi:MAG: cadmium-translocating P-type ATPase [Marinicaulis sp.]|nr:cadmium-translocating P-type ATPase [Marinicaulis sp.]